MVRLIDAFRSCRRVIRCTATAGASGIDGLISTAAGVLRPARNRTLAIVGSLSLYDLNALALLRQASALLVLIVNNNNGGRFSSLLPTPVQSERERFHLMPQNVQSSNTPPPCSA